MNRARAREDCADNGCGDQQKEAASVVSAAIHGHASMKALGDQRKGGHTKGGCHHGP